MSAVSMSSSSRSSGAVVLQQQQQRQYSSPAPLTVKKRPNHTKVLGALAAIGGVDALLLAAGISPLASILPSIKLGALLNPIIWAVPYFMAFLGIVSVVSAYGYLSHREWAWKLGFGVAVLAIGSVLFSNYIGVVTGAATIYYLSRFETKLLFHRV